MGSTCEQSRMEESLLKQACLLFSPVQTLHSTNHTSWWAAALGHKRPFRHGNLGRQLYHSRNMLYDCPAMHWWQCYSATRHFTPSHRVQAQSDWAVVFWLQPSNYNHSTSAAAAGTAMSWQTSIFPQNTFCHHRHSSTACGFPCWSWGFSLCGSSGLCTPKRSFQQSFVPAFVRGFMPWWMCRNAKQSPHKKKPVCEVVLS